jgi:uncharacterized damage-inducible protein DinB
VIWSPGSKGAALPTTSSPHLRAIIQGLSAADLETVPPALAQRNITIGKALQILVWHEAHHQGQAHLTLNLYKAQHGIS